MSSTATVTSLKTTKNQFFTFKFMHDSFHLQVHNYPLCVCLPSVVLCCSTVPLTTSLCGSSSVPIAAVIGSFDYGTDTR